jgi:hypothetical protein
MAFTYFLAIEYYEPKWMLLHIENGGWWKASQWSTDLIPDEYCTGLSTL